MISFKELFETMNVMNRTSPVRRGNYVHADKSRTPGEDGGTHNVVDSSGKVVASYKNKMDAIDHANKKDEYKVKSVYKEAVEIAEGYIGRETKDGTWHVFKTGRAVAVAGPFKSREEASAWITKKSMSEEVQLEEAKIPVEHAVKAVTRVLGSVSAAKFATHLRPGTEKHTTWDKINTALKNQGVKPQHIAKIAVHTRPAQYEEVEINELSKKTLGKYVKAAAQDAEQSGRDQEYHGHKNDYARGEKRQKGIAKAVDRLTKEEVDLDEAVSVEHDRYMRSHGKKASGSGNWMFTHKRAGDVDYKNDKEVHQARGSFADAAKSAKSWAKSHGHSTVYVMEEVELDESKSTASKPYYRIVGTISPELKKRLSTADEKRRENARQLMQRPTKPTSEESQKEEVEGVAEETLDEMDKSAPQPGRDGKVSHSTYGSRDKEGSDYFKGKESRAKAITAKQAEKDALDILKKQGVAEDIEPIDEVSKELANRVSTARRKQADASSAKDPYLKPSAETIAKKKKADQAHSSWIKRMFRDNNRGKTQADISRDHAAVADQNYKRGWSNEEVEIDEAKGALTYKPEHAKWGVVPKSSKEFVKFFPKEKEADAKAHAEKTGGTLKKIDQAGRAMREEVESEHLDELSKPTLGKYIRLASRDASRAAGSRELHKKLGQDQYAKEAEKARKKRQAGIDKATQRLTAEDNEVQEKILSFGEFITK